MRGLMRNKRPIVYKNYVRTDYQEDSLGRKTGKKIVVYGEAKTVYGTVSTPTGGVSIEMFGAHEDYSKIVVLDQPDIDISETSVLWIDHEYTEDTPYDYIVKKVIRNHNFLTIGLRKVDVKNAQNQTTVEPSISG